MEGSFFVLIILVALVADVVLFRHISWLPLPFLFIITGIVLSFLPQYTNYVFDSDYFLFFVVTPLLYIEAQNVSRYWVGRGSINIFSLAIMLVVVTIVVVGFILHKVFPIIPLALAFALCAIVTPTDASAVSAFSKPNPEFKIPNTILKNESLFNDASGFVAFDLAIIAFTTGEFSLADGAAVFITEFFGGLVFGAIVGMIFHYIRLTMISWSDDTPFVMISLELIVPFVIYFFANQIHVSGILAVVAAGLVQGLETDNLRLVSSQVQLVRNHIWDVVTQSLDGFIFIILGISLPAILHQINSTSNSLLFTLTLVGISLYVLKFLLRLIWTRYFVWMHISSNHRWKDSLLMAVSGASGTISLSLAFLLPKIKTLPGGINRTSLIYAATVVILISLTVAAIAVPKITSNVEADQNKSEDSFDELNEKMIRAAIKEVRSHKECAAEADVVINALSQQLHQSDSKNRHEMKKLFDIAHGAERTAIEQLHNSGQINDKQFEYYSEYMELTYYTIHSNFFKRLWLRLKFTSHSGKLYKDFQILQDALLTSPLITEQTYWKDQFKREGWDIRDIESIGFKAVIAALRKVQHEHGEVKGLPSVFRLYEERHRRMSLGTPQPDKIYQLFLNAFHAEFVYLQNELADNKMSLETAQELQQQIIYDQMAYLNNDEGFVNR